MDKFTVVMNYAGGTIERTLEASSTLTAIEEVELTFRRHYEATSGARYKGGLDFKVTEINGVPTDRRWTR